MEAEFVEWLGRRVQPASDVRLGIGDDAAVVDHRGSDLVYTTDLLCDGVHFVWGEATPQQVGYKALAVNLSDMAAMAAQPCHALVSLLWPKQFDWRLACDLYEGLFALADEYAVRVIGGDTNRWDGGLAINIMLSGVATDRGCLRRDGARVGDRILVTGELGGSLSGHHLCFRPRVNEALELHRRFLLHAGMDITDGLSIDLQRLLHASGVGAELQFAQVPVSSAADAVSKSSGRSPLHHALHDGEDFELLLVVDSVTAEEMQQQELPVDLHEIGMITETPGLWGIDIDGKREQIPADGYLH